MLLTLGAVVLLSQVIVYLLWMAQYQARDQALIVETSRSLAASITSTVRFFISLPQQYRRLALDQLRDMGGTRFFVSLNREHIQVDPYPRSGRKKSLFLEITRMLRERLGEKRSLTVEFSQAQDLRVLTNETMLSDLPASWADYALALDPLDQPVLVMQVKMEKGQWLYIAAHLPSALMTLVDDTPSRRQIISVVVLTLLLLLAAFILGRWLSRPVQRIAHAAEALGRDLEQAPVEVRGPLEIRRTAQAFNDMQARLRRYVDDRSRLFSAISHDLKTPITRLRLRAEMLPDAPTQRHFIRNLEELDLMVKGALQTVKDTEIHENVERVDIVSLLTEIREQLPDPEQLSIQPVDIPPYRGKSLALKRCLSNIIENGLRYGDRVEVRLVDSQDELCIKVIDHGPGIATPEQERVFKPYVRLVKDQEGTGLGLGIARSIVHGHGGALSLKNRKTGGLMVCIRLPRTPD